MAESYADALRFRAVEAFKSEDYESAILLFDELVQITEHIWDCQWRALTFLLLGRYAEAHEVFLQVLGEYPEDACTLNYIAHLNATCPDSTIRNGKKAVEYATRACELSAWNNWAYLSVLAAAYAELSDWAQATRYGEQALEYAPENEKTRRQYALQLFRQHKPYRSNVERDRERLHYREDSKRLADESGDEAR